MNVCKVASRIRLPQERGRLVPFYGVWVAFWGDGASPLPVCGLQMSLHLQAVKGDEASPLPVCGCRCHFICHPICNRIRYLVSMGYGDISGWVADGR